MSFSILSLSMSIAIAFRRRIRSRSIPLNDDFDIDQFHDENPGHTPTSRRFLLYFVFPYMSLGFKIGVLCIDILTTMSSPDVRTLRLIQNGWHSLYVSWFLIPFLAS